MIHGSCHCGAVRWQFKGMPESATACNCTVCRRYGVLWAYDFEGEGISVLGPTRVYVRGEAIEFFLGELGDTSRVQPHPWPDEEAASVTAPHSISRGVALTL